MAAGIITTSTLPSTQLVSAMYSVGIHDFKAADKQIDQIAKKKKQDKGPYLETKKVGTMPILSELGEGASKPLIDVNEGHLWRLTPKVYAGASVVTEVMRRDDRQDIILQIPSLLAKAAVETRETICTNALFNNAFTTTLCGDGQPVYSASHTWRPGGATFSNLLGATAFGVDSLWTMIDLMRELTDDTGKPLGLIPDGIWYGIALDRRVDEVLGTQLFPDDNRNAINAVRKFNLERTCIRRVTSDTAWGLYCKSAHGLYIWDVWPTAFGHDGDFMTDNSLFSAKLRFAAGVEHPVGLVGTVGA